MQSSFFPLQAHKPPQLPPRRSNKESVPEESFATLVGSIHQDLVRLIEVEKAQAREELDQRVRELKSDALIAVGGALLAGFFLLCLAAAAILGLSLIVAPWAAVLLVGGALAATACALMLRFQTQLKHFDPLPRATVPRAKHDVRTVGLAR